MASETRTFQAPNPPPGNLTTQEDRPSTAHGEEFSRFVNEFGGRPGAYRTNLPKSDPSLYSATPVNSSQWRYDSAWNRQTGAQVGHRPEQPTYETYRQAAGQPQQHPLQREATRSALPNPDTTIQPIRYADPYPVEQRQTLQLPATYDYEHVGPEFPFAYWHREPPPLWYWSPARPNATFPIPQTWEVRWWQREAHEAWRRNKVLEQEIQRCRLLRDVTGLAELPTIPKRVDEVGVDSGTGMLQAATPGGAPGSREDVHGSVDHQSRRARGDEKSGLCGGQDDDEGCDVCP